MAAQDLRGFVAAYEEAHPGEVIRVTEPVSIDEDVMALVLEYERRRRYPILLFDRVAGHDIPIVCNVVANPPPPGLCPPRGAGGNPHRGAAPPAESGRAQPRTPLTPPPRI